MTRLVVLAAALLSCAVALAQPMTLRRGNVAEPGTLDPQKYFNDYEEEILRDLFAGLLSIDAKAQPIPGLAERWTVSADGRTWTFHLRAGLTWSDGKPLTASDAVFALRRAFDPATQNNYANLAYNILNAEAVLKKQMPPEKLGVRAPDPRTVEITLHRPSPVLLILLASRPFTYPLPEHAVKAHGDAWVKPGVMVSSGAYTFAAWRPSDHVKLVKNPRFYDASTVRVTDVFFYPTVDDSAALTRFRAGELDLNIRFPPNQIDWLMRNLPGQAIVTPAYWVTYLVPNFQHKPFQDPRVRRALALALDRKTLTDRVLRNGEKPHAGIVPDIIPEYGTHIAIDARPPEQRLAEARALLAQAGYGPDRPLSFTFSHRAGQTNRVTAVAIADMWRAAGVQTTLMAADVAVHYAKLKEGDFEMADAGYAESGDPEFFTVLLETSATQLNYGRYSNPKFDAAAGAAKGILDTKARFAAFAAAERIAMGEDAVIGLFLSVERTLVKPHLKGWEANPMGQYPTRFMRIEGRP
jgi:oligopeptide transport system substrate-binding protein